MYRKATFPWAYCHLPLSNKINKENGILIYGIEVVNGAKNTVLHI